MKLPHEHGCSRCGHIRPNKTCEVCGPALPDNCPKHDGPKFHGPMPIVVLIAKRRAELNASKQQSRIRPSHNWGDFYRNERIKELEKELQSLRTIYNKQKNKTMKKLIKLHEAEGQTIIGTYQTINHKHRKCN